MSLDTFLLLLKAHDLPAPQTEYVFSTVRKFRADYAWPDALVIVEKSGGIWQKGGHSSGRGILRDYAKSNLAQVEGWVYLQFTPQQLDRGDALLILKEVLDVDSSGSVRTRQQRGRRELGPVLPPVRPSDRTRRRDRDRRPSFFENEGQS